MTPSYLKYNYFKLKLEWSVRCESNASDFIKAINLHTDDKIILWWDVIKHSQTLQLFLYYRNAKLQFSMKSNTEAFES